MTSGLRSFGIALVWLAFASILPAPVGAQVYLTQWGSSGTGGGTFNQPHGVATDAAGNVYVVDTQNHRIHKFTNTGTFLIHWGAGSTPGSGDGQFSNPTGVATNAAGDIYVVDTGNDRIQKFGPVPTPTTGTSWGRLKGLYR